VASLDWSVWWWPLTADGFLLIALGVLVVLVFVGRTRFLWAILLADVIALAVLLGIAFWWAEHHLTG